MKPEDRKRLKQHIEMIVEHRMPIVFCPNCEKYVECIHTAELYECKECGEDFARYIVSRKPANSDVSMTQDVLTDIKTGRSIENTNPDYYKDELYLDEDFRTLAKTYPADVSAIGVTTLIDYVEAVEAELARRINELHYANTVCMEQKHKIARRDEIITRLKEVNEQYRCTECGHFVEIQDDATCDVCHVGKMEHLRYIKGGNGSHWDGCTDVHWDCRIAHLTAELARRDEKIAELEAMVEELKDEVDPADYHPIKRG